MAESAAQRAARTARWALTMTRWRISFETNGRRIGAGVSPTRRWQIVPFPGPQGRESRGIVDFLLIRKDHRTQNGVFKRGDLFEIVLMQVKGGTARWPTDEDVVRLRAVARRYHARAVLLAEWKKGLQPQFLRLRPRGPSGRAWDPVDPGEVLT